MSVLRVVQITDCHVAGDPAARYRGIDARAHLDSVLETVSDWGPDLVLATGDLSEDAHPDSYDWLAARLFSLGVPVMATPGNHDEVSALATQFAATANDAPLVFEVGGWCIILLNSAIPGEVPGRLDTRVLEALDQTLAGTGLPTLVGLHHQPILVGSPWIDKYPLLEPERFWDIIRSHSAVRAVVWGHIHHAVDIDMDGVRALGGPSTASNSLPGQERFTLDESGPACRWLELGSDGALETGVLKAGSQTSTISKSSL